VSLRGPIPRRENQQFLAHFAHFLSNDVQKEIKKKLERESPGAQLISVQLNSARLSPAQLDFHGNRMGIHGKPWGSTKPAQKSRQTTWDPDFGPRNGVRNGVQKGAQKGVRNGPRIGWFLGVGVGRGSGQGTRAKQGYCGFRGGAGGGSKSDQKSGRKSGPFSGSKSDQKSGQKSGPNRPVSGTNRDFLNAKRRKSAPEARPENRKNLGLNESLA